MVVLASFNCNGLHDHRKWHPTWKLLMSTRADIIVLQETHLQLKQEWAFKLHAQSFDCFFSHGTSQLVGVAVMVCRNAGFTVKSFIPVSLHLGVLDISHLKNDLHFIVCYAPSQGRERGTFFSLVRENIIQGSTIVMGDLNTVRTQHDHTSRKLDTMSVMWNNICSDFDLQEPQGSNFYTYQYPTLPRQSCINYVIGPKLLMDNMYLNSW